MAWSRIPIPAALCLLALTGSVLAGDYRPSRSRVVVLDPGLSCDCTVVRHLRRGEIEYVVPRAPRVDYGQALPIYQPPIYAHPREVVPVYPIFPRSGAYPVMETPGRPPMLERRPYYPVGSDARVITLDEPPPAPARPNRPRR